METILNFSENNGVWEAKYTSSGNSVIQVERNKPGSLEILANLTGFQPVMVNKYESFYNSNVFFKVEIPAGIEITIQSETEVMNAKMLSA